MLCDICNENDATFHIKEIINSKHLELHLCESCAKDKGFGKELNVLPILLNELADNLLNENPQKKKTPQFLMKCENCGMSYAKFRELGQLGCGECYLYFSKQLKLLLRKIHGSIKHNGKKPENINEEKILEPLIFPVRKVNIEELRTKLQNAVKKEEYEEAVKLRDLIFDLEKIK